jgi:hypothetical protein
MLVRSFRCYGAHPMPEISFTVLMLVQGAVCSEPLKVESGLVQGAVEDGLFVYPGIPYAAPPRGDLGWQAPQPAPKWQGVRVANEFGRACIQSNPAIANLPAPSEDCRYLNVWTTPKSATDRLPVMDRWIIPCDQYKLYHAGLYKILRSWWAITPTRVPPFPPHEQCGRSRRHLPDQWRIPLK